MHILFIPSTDCFISFAMTMIGWVALSSGGSPSSAITLPLSLHYFDAFTISSTGCRIPFSKPLIPIMRIVICNYEAIVIAKRSEAICASKIRLSLFNQVISQYSILHHFMHILFIPSTDCFIS
ncbi:MAG: hypothetical protein ABI813_01010, partial [Bacteroidota bacterium]